MFKKITSKIFNNIFAAIRSTIDFFAFNKVSNNILDRLNQNRNFKIVISRDKDGQNISNKFADLFAFVYSQDHTNLLLDRYDILLSFDVET